MSGDTLILATAHTTAAARQQVAQGITPRIDYLDLQERLNADLIDHNIYANPILRTMRTPEHALRLSWSQALYAMRRWRNYNVVYSLSEDIGLPMAVLMRMLHRPAQHLMMVHSVLSPSKVRLIRSLGGLGDFSQIIALTQSTARQIQCRYGAPAEKVTALLDGVDEQFWHPHPTIQPEPGLVVSLGKARRDYETVINAVRRLPLQLHIQASSQWSIQYATRVGEIPTNVRVGCYVSFAQLRALYARAAFVVVALQPDAHHSAGTVTIKEAMAMGKAVIVASAGGMEDYIEDGVTGLITPAGDVFALRQAIRDLLAHPQRAAEMGRAARLAVETQMSYEQKISRLVRLAEIQPYYF